MPFALPPARTEHPDKFCHGCGQMFSHREGADLYCSPGCAGETAVRKTLAIDKLKEAGFEEHPEAPHTFIKDGIAVSIEQVLREGHEAVLKAHAAVAAS